MSSVGHKDYKTLAEFANAATVGLAAVIRGARTPAQFREWLRWVTIRGSGLEPETHRLLDMMAACAAKGSSGSGSSGLGTAGAATKPQDPKPRNPAVMPQDPKQ
ncbi:MAG TPA: hypothetical protein P5137_18035 [Candidatus Brocadiia bacterium]|nr:hypothetical protein [Candidatus Brocadiia bacterium]